MSKFTYILHFFLGLLISSLLLVPVFSVSGTYTGTGNIADYSAELSAIGLGQNPIISPNPQQWDLIQTGTPKAWEIVPGGQGVKVAVLDTGIDNSISEFTGKEIARTNFSRSQNIDMVRGHGTYVAGIIAANAADKGITGVAYNSTLLDVQVANNDGSTDANKVAQGIFWAVDNGAKVINISITIGESYPLLESAVNYAWNKGSLIVAAAGNNFSSSPVFPAAYPNVISVAATDKSDNLAKWSNYGDWVSVAAPGLDIYSVLPGGKYAVKSGTSYSAALVSGEAALLFATATDINGDGQINDEIYDAIIGNGDNLAAPAIPGKRVNVYTAVKSTVTITRMSASSLLP